MEALITVRGAIAAVGVVVIGLMVCRGIRIYRERNHQWECLDRAGIERALDLLLTRGYVGAFGILTDKSTNRFVQFRKYIVAPGDIGLEMHFPRSEWSAPFYSAVQDTLRHHNVSFNRVALPTDGTSEVIQADFGRDVDLTARVTAEIMLDVFRVPKLCLELKADDICPMDQLVDRVDHPRPSALIAAHLRGSDRRKP